jgi:hypothetical protein
MFLEKLGKCIYTLDNVWMTPAEYQEVSGCTGADWRTSIKLRLPHIFIENNETKKNLRKDLISIKTLVDNKTLQVHSFECECSKCHDNLIMQVFFI